MQLHAIITDPDPIKLSIQEIPINLGTIRVDDQSHPVYLVKLEESKVSLEIVGLKYAESIPLVGAIHKALINPINEMSTRDLVVKDYLLRKSASVFW